MVTEAKPVDDTGETGMPALYRSVGQSSLAGQRRFLQATRIRLLGLVVTAVGGAFTAVLGSVDLLGLLGLLGLVTALAAEIYVLRDRPDRTWYEGRAAAESVKTLAWRYMVGGDPFPRRVADDDDAAADELFLQRLQEILQDLDGLNATSDPRSTSQITPEMQALRQQDLAARREAYRVDRIVDQHDWYVAKSAWNRRRSDQWSTAVLALEGLGVVVAAMKAFTFIGFDLLGLVAAGAAAITAWSQAKQHEVLSRAYFVASQELASITAQIDRVTGEPEWSRFVQESEEAISREHTLWRASRGIHPRRR
jgi:hypothetical protein